MQIVKVLDKFENEALTSSQGQGHWGQKYKNCPWCTVFT